jgi:hypothetical protein
MCTSSETRSVRRRQCCAAPSPTDIPAPVLPVEEYRARLRAYTAQHLAAIAERQNSRIVVIGGVPMRFDVAVELIEGLRRSGYFDDDDRYCDERY